MNYHLSWQDICEIAKRHYFMPLAVISISDMPHRLAKHKERVALWQSENRAKGLHYMMYEPETYCNFKPKGLELKTVLVMGAKYFNGPTEPLKKGYGRVARYACGRDYHKVLKKKVKKMMEQLEEKLGIQIRYRYFSDAVPLLERALAYEGHAGFFGRNTMLIRYGEGSYFFLCEVFLDVEVKGFISVSDVKIKRSIAEYDAMKKNNINVECGRCVSCVQKCPTSAINYETGLISAQRCISYLTIEHKGLLTEEQKVDIGEWIFGCDICQDECPFNYATIKSASMDDVMEEFLPRSGVGLQISLKEVISLKHDEEFRERFKGTPIMRAKRQGLIRNAAVVAGNTACRDLVPLLYDRVKDSDLDYSTKDALNWAIARLR